MADRYNNRIKFRNSSKNYRKFFQKRGVKNIEHYNTPKLKHATSDQIAMLDSIKHFWKQGDRYYKLAHKHYGDSSLWWVIAWFNQKPTEFHVKKGDVIRIPSPLDRVFNFMGV